MPCRFAICALSNLLRVSLHFWHVFDLQSPPQCEHRQTCFGFGLALEPYHRNDWLKAMLATLLRVTWNPKAERARRAADPNVTPCFMNAS